MLSKIIVLGVIFLAACGVFYNSLSNDFAFDDHLAIVTNGDTSTDTPWIELWRNDIWGKNLRAPDSHRSYRPLLVMVFKFLRRGYGLDATAFRVFSIGCHGFASVLVYFCSVEIIGNDYLSAVAALLFATHPVHVESVASVVNLAEPLSCIFYLAAFLIYRANISAFEKNKQSSCISSYISALAKLFWLGLVIIAALVKETGITAAGLVVADCVISFFVLLTKGHAKTNEEIWIRTWLSFRFWWVFIAGLALLLYAFLRMAIVKADIVDLAFAVRAAVRERSFESAEHIVRLWSSGAASADNLYLGSSELIRKAENPFAFLAGTEAILSTMYLHFRYVLLLVFPVHLSAEYAFDCIPKVVDLADARNLLSFSLYSVVIFCLLYDSYNIYCSRMAKMQEPPDGNRTNDIVLLKKEGIIVAISWFIVAFSPISGVFLTLGTLLAERLLYIPSIGFCIGIAVYLHRFVSLCFKSALLPVGNQTTKLWTLTLAAVILSLFSYRTIQRNPDWKNDSTLHLSSYSVCPRSAKLNLQIAKLRMNNLNLTGARWHVDHAREIDPDFCDVDFQYAMLEIHQHQYERAVPYLTKSLRCIYTSMQAWPLLNQIWENQIKISKGNSRVYENIGSILNETGLYAVSAKQYLTGASRAFDEANYKLSVELLISAEDVIGRLEEEVKSGNNSAALTKPLLEVKCHCDALGGIILSALERSTDKISSKLKKRLVTRFNKIDQLLLEAASPSCVLVEEQTGVVSQFPLLALQQLQGRLPTDAQSNISSYVVYGNFLDTSVKIHRAYLKITNNDKYALSLRQLVDAAILVWKTAGQSYFYSNQHDDARSCFERALAHANSSADVEQAVPCSVFYWYAHALAGEPSFLDHGENILAAIDALSVVVSCPDALDEEEMRELADDQIKKLTAYFGDSFGFQKSVL